MDRFVGISRRFGSFLQVGQSAANQKAERVRALGFYSVTNRVR